MLLDVEFVQKSIWDLPPEDVYRHKAYQPFGSALELMYAKDDEIVIDGPAGTGKSRGALEKLHLCAMKYTGMRGLLVRKSRASLTQSAVVTFDTLVVPNNGYVNWRTSEQEYRYANGSTIVLGGMDKSSKIMSTEYDLIFVQEGTELSEPEFEDLTTRARHGIMPYNQVILDCNPGPATHWVKRRWEAGKARRIPSKHEDNPRLYNPVTKQWREFGIKYLARLDNLSGVRKQRLRHGLWVSAEGMIFDNFDYYHHVIDRFPIPASWRKFCTIDFGYTNPFVCQWWALDEDNRLYRYREIYFTKRTVRHHAEIIKEQSGGENIEIFVCDHDAEDRATLAENGLSTMAADKAVTPGIQAVQERLRIQPDGKARLYFLRDSLVELDQDLADGKLPTETVQEFDGYMWANKDNKDEPVKKDDHGMDGVRYAVRYADNYSPTGGIYL